MKFPAPNEISQRSVLEIQKKVDNLPTIKTIVLCRISPPYVIYLCVHAPLSTLFMQQGLGFVAAGADTAAQRSAEEEGEQQGVEMVLSCTTVSSYHCSQKNERGKKRRKNRRQCKV